MNTGKWQSHVIFFCFGDFEDNLSFTRLGLIAKRVQFAKNDDVVVFSAEHRENFYFSSRYSKQEQYC
jgi:hypothetical protein